MTSIEALFPHLKHTHDHTIPLHAHTSTHLSLVITVSEVVIFNVLLTPLLAPGAPALALTASTNLGLATPTKHTPGGGGG
jgi:hypothetical protein